MSNKCEEILDFICSNEIKIAALQDTKLTARSMDPSFEGYTVVRKDRGSNGGGLLFLIHQSIPFTAVVVEPSPAAPMEHQSVRIPFGKESLTVHNIYIPPSSSCPSSFNPTLAQFLKSSCSLTLGDFNAHDTLWCSPIHDQRGESLADEISMSSSGVLNTDTQTRLPSSGQPTSPDVSIASEDLLTSANWKTSTTLSSDHLPITVSLNLAPDLLPAPKRTFVNFNRADWTNFQMETESEFAKAEEQPDAYQSEKLFRRIVGKAAAHHIPSGRRRQRHLGWSKNAMS